MLKYSDFVSMDMNDFTQKHFCEINVFIYFLVYIFSFYLMSFLIKPENEQIMTEPQSNQHSNFLKNTDI